MLFSVFGDSISTFHDIVPEDYLVFYNREMRCETALAGCRISGGVR